MEKTALAIEMLLLLKSRGIIKKQEIAKELEISEKMVQRLRNELEIAGYYITSLTGKYGGYQLENGTLFPVAELDDEERYALARVSSYLMTLKNPLITPVFKRAYSKIVANSTTNNSPIESFSERVLNFDPKVLDQYLNVLNEAIQRKHRVTIIYQNKEKKYVLEPYSLFVVNNAWYVTGYLKHQDLVTFKLNRIHSVHLLDETFLKDETFSLNKHLNDFGFKIDKPIAIECIITNHNYLTEYIFGDNQTIEILNQKQIKVNVTFYSLSKSKEFIFKFGSDIEIIKPIALKEIQKEAAIDILNR